MDLQGFSKRISELVDRFTDGNNTKFAESIESSEANVRNYRSAKTTPKLEILYNIASKYEINYEWLLNGEGEMFKKTSVDRKKEEHNTDAGGDMSVYRLKTDYYETNRQSIPLFELDAAAGLTTLFSSQNHQIPLDYIMVPNAPKCDGALFVRGDSMYPILKSGDIICYKHIEQIDDIYWGEMYLLDIDISGDQYLTLKYVQKSDLGDEFVRLVSHNSHHSSKDVNKKDIRAVALIKVSIRYNTLS